MTAYLLDANVLIAISAFDHADRQRTKRWIRDVTRFAVCPITEGALVRYFVRIGRYADEAQAVLRALAGRPGYEFWPDDLSYANAGLGDIKGHKQVTDAYLVALTRTHPGAKLATLDVALAADHVDVAELIP